MEYRTRAGSACSWKSRSPSSMVYHHSAGSICCQSIVERSHNTDLREKRHLTIEFRRSDVDLAIAGADTMVEEDHDVTRSPRLDEPER